MTEPSSAAKAVAALPKLSTAETMSRIGGRRSGAWDRLRKNRLAVAGGVLLLAIVIMAIAAPLISPFDPVEQNRRLTLDAPSSQHLLGTDAYGRDVLSRLIYGSRTTLAISLTTVVGALVAGVIIGLIGGYAGGVTDSVLMRIMDALLSFPQVLLALALLATLGPETRNIVIALAIVNVPAFARIARATTLSVREEEYIAAARSVGVSTNRILVRHVLPNIAAPIVVQASQIFATTMISVATLSFLGLGPQPPTPDWGRDLSDARRYIRDARWLIYAPATAISLVVLAVNFFGDGLRDALDPRHSRGK